MSSQRKTADRFAQTYSTAVTDAHSAIQREVFGQDTWVNGYTTPAQADLLAERLGLRPDIWLLDIGAGTGWPSIYLAKKTGCQTFLTDLPEPGLRRGLDRAVRERVSRLCSFALASGTHLPFRAATFDAMAHTDTL